MKLWAWGIYTSLWMVILATVSPRRFQQIVRDFAQGENERKADQHMSVRDSGQ